MWLTGSVVCCGRLGRLTTMPTETAIETMGDGRGRPRLERIGVCPDQSGGGCGIRTREGVNPTRFPSERHRPLGESSARNLTGKLRRGRIGTLAPKGRASYDLVSPAPHLRVGPCAD